MKLDLVGSTAPGTTPKLQEAPLTSFSVQTPTPGLQDPILKSGD